jgi:UDP-N-acetylglucosamine 2-epimerase (non-hydrolysing)
MKKILVVFGTRPEAIKMAPVVKMLEKYRDSIDFKVCITAQHREMLDQVLDIFRIKPDFDLNIMKQGQDLYDVTSRVLLGMRQVLDDYKPDLVLVHGDTTTSTSAALAAFYRQIKVGHVEAGLRTGNINAPWPEEMNRMLTRCLTQYHFAPTSLSKNNLLKENVDEQTIFVTGNTVIDALYIILDMIKQDQSLKAKLNDQVVKCGYTITEGKKIILVTGHRRENFGEGFINICNALKDIATRHPEFDIVYPVHLNPNVQKPVFEILSNISNIYLINPLEYLTFVYLMERSYLIITDSGGIQEEAPSIGIPVLVMRDTTERPEAVDAGTVILVGTNREKIVNNVIELIESKESYETMSRQHNPYGDGEASDRIVQVLLKY